MIIDIVTKIPVILWNDPVQGVFKSANLLTALAYISISVILMWLLLHSDIPFTQLFRLGAAFVLFCGVGHLMMGLQADFVALTLSHCATAAISLLSAVALGLHARQVAQYLIDAKEAQLRLETAAVAAQRASTAKSEFLANMSHEIRTPMNAIIGFSQLLETTFLDGQQKAYLDTITKSGETLMMLIDDILDLSKLEAGELKLQVVEFDLNETVHSVIRQFTPQIQQKGLQLQLAIAPDVPQYLEGPVNRLQQVLVNLINNAIKFTDHGTIEVTIRAVSLATGTVATSRDIELYVSVRDTGIGIAPENQSRIFNLFTQVETSASRQYDGTGLGLAICKKIIDLMQGQIGVDSALGNGSTFWFRVPLRRSQRQATGEDSPTAATSQNADSDRTKGRILVVEDVPVNQELMLTILAKFGYEAVIAEDGQAALTSIEQQPFDLVLMDCQLPDIDGYETTRCIRQRTAPQGPLPIIGVTAHAMVGDRDRCLAAGMDDYLSKPIQLDHLEATLAKWLTAVPKTPAG